MIKANDNFEHLPQSYLFSEVGRRVQAYRDAHPDTEIIRMDIGDIKQPLFPCVVEAICRAAGDLGSPERFHGYGPEQGYPFLRDAIAGHDYADRGLAIEPDDIFVSDGAKSDLGNLGDIFSRDCRIAVMNPSYPVYVDDNVMDGRAGTLADGKWSRLVYLDCDAAGSFMPALPQEPVDVVYLCFPNNPTGEAISLAELNKWVEYARANGVLLIFDSAYEAFVRREGMVRSVYEAEGAGEVAIEVRSFSKTAGFTGLRCGYTVVPRKLKARYRDGRQVSLNTLWNRRQTTKFNGASYVSQRAAEAVYTPEGQACVRKATDGYLANARLIRNTLAELGYNAFGGEDSPYVWASRGNGDDSWQVFGRLLDEHGVSTTPGSGFGSGGDGYIRLTGFNTAQNTLGAMERLLRDKQ